VGLLLFTHYYTLLLLLPSIEYIISVILFVSSNLPSLLNSSGKAQIILKLADMIESLAVKNNISYIQLQWKENGISPDNGDTEQILGKEGDKSFVANQVSKKDEGGLGKPQLNKRQEKSSSEGSRFFMANLKSSVRTNNRRKEESMKKTILTKDLNVEEEQRNNVMDFGLRILHHDVQSLSNKKNEVIMMLTVDGRHINILCLTEHWLKEDQLNAINIDQFKLVSKYCRISSTLGGSCIYVNNTIQCKEVPWFDNLGSDEVFELSVVELFEHHIILACIYRSPDSDFYEFLNKLEALIVKASSKAKCVILCGDWNVNFLHQNGKLQDLQNLLRMNNLTNVIKVPTRITSLSKSLIDVVIVNNNKEERLVEVLDMGYSDHLAQYVHMKVNKVREEPIMMYKRQFTNTNMDHFRHVMYEEKWKEVVKANEPNAVYEHFYALF